HFINIHGFRKIAFVTGTRGNRDAEERFEAYKKGLQDAGIPFNPDYVVDGHFVSNSGVEAINTLYDERKLEVEAIICSNDNEALGVYNEMARRGKTPPYDYTVSGFDDTDFAASLFPGLTTVNQSLDDFCRTALKVLADQVAGRKVELHTLSPARVVVRSTCGCAHSQAQRSKIIETGNQAEESKSGERTVTARTINEKLAGYGQNYEEQTIALLLDSLHSEVFENTRGLFLPSFEKFLSSLFYRNIELTGMQDLISELKNGIMPQIRDLEQVKTLENLVHHARIIIEQTEIIRINREHQNVTRKYQQITTLGNTISSSLNMDELFANMHSAFPGAGINNFLLALYHRGNTDSAVLKVLIRNGQKAEQTDAAPFPSKNLCPADISFNAKILFVCPLYSLDQNFGYMLFEHVYQSDYVIWNIAQMLNRSLYSLFLVRQILETESQIQQKNSRIEELVKPMLDSIRHVRRISDEQSSKAITINTTGMKNAEKVKELFSLADELQSTLLETNRLVKSIDDISETINIVALNASIQAAHAGSFGKGFAVIAGEVRRLSQSTASNVTKINNFLKTIKSGFEGFIGVNRQAGMVLLEMSEQISELSASLQEVSEKMDHLSGSSNDILDVMK
ncbi:MAG: substrate-binding domain-containing protein, partial [Spirochaetales bacterium]|nr:substrate-binding domain-containing protein [Spirochaetales bacterium]